MCPTGLFNGASPYSNPFPTQCSRHPLRLSARKMSKREGRGSEEKARRRRMEEGGQRRNPYQEHPRTQLQEAKGQDWQNARSA